MDSQYSTSQNHKRSVDYTYDESKELLEPSAHTHRQLSSSYSGSQSHPLVDGQFFDTSFPLSQIPQVYGSTPDLTMSQYASSMWNRHGHVQQSTSFSPNFPNSNDYNFEPSTTYTTQGTTDGMFGRGMEFGGIPRTWNGYNSALAQTTTMSGFELSQSNMLTETSGHTEGMESNNVSRESTCDFQPQRMAHSPKFFTENPSMHNDHGGHDALTFNTPTSVRMGSCEVIDDTEGLTSGELTSTEVDDMTADEPYAKLIYRALMSTPNHSMVLQEIYQWFRENTNKGSSDSKGWMNSIRHNLSMNGVSLSLPPSRFWGVVPSSYMTNNATNRHSRRVSASIPPTRPKSPQSGCWTIRPSERDVFSLPLVSGKGQEVGSTPVTNLQRLLANVLAKKDSFRLAVPVAEDAAMLSSAIVGAVMAYPS